MVVEASSAPAKDVVPSTTPTPTPQPEPQPTPTPTPTPTTKTIYRVQVGVFKTALNRNRIANNIKKKTGLPTFWEKKNGQFYLYCGSFENKSVASQRVTRLKSKGFNAIIKEVTM